MIILQFKPPPLKRRKPQRIEGQHNILPSHKCGTKDPARGGVPMHNAAIVRLACEIWLLKHGHNPNESKPIESKEERTEAINIRQREMDWLKPYRFNGRVIANEMDEIGP